MRKIAAALLLALGLAGHVAAQVPPAVPALPDSQRLTSYSISGTTCTCSVGFAIYGDSTDVDEWVQVWISGVQYLSTDASHGWSLSSATGPLATIARPITDAVLTFNSTQTGTVQILGARRPRRLSQYTEGRGVAARDLNQAITDLVAQNREQWDLVNRAIIGQPGEVVQAMPSAATRAGKFLYFDGTGLIPQFTTGGAGSGNVVGPPSSTAGHLALWNNATGTLLLDAVMSGDCTIAISGAITCTKTSGVAFGTAATQNTGTSGATLPFLNGNNTFSGDAYFKSGRPWIDVRAYGALGDGSTDDTTAIQNAINAATGGTVYFPPGNYCIKTSGGISVTTAGLWLVGSSSDAGTSLSTCGADVQLITLNADTVVLRSLSLNGAGLNVSANHNVITLGTGCVRCQLSQLNIFGGYYNIANNAPYTFFDHLRTGNAHGPAVIDNVTSSSSSPGFYMRDSQIDQNWPVSTPSNISSFSAWASSHAYSSGNVVSNSGYYLQESAATCTSGGSAPTNLDYGNSITDGTCTWKLVAPTVFDGVLLDTGTINVDIASSDFTGPYTNGVHLKNSLSGTGPISVILGDMNTWGGNITASVNAEAGYILNIHDGQIQNGVLAAHVGVWMQSGFGGQYVINNMTMYSLGNSSNGVLDQASAGNGGTIANNRIFTGSGTGISIGANINNRTISGNHAGLSSLLGSNAACIFVSSGTGDYLNIVGNDCNGATSSGVTVTSVTGTHNWVVNGGSATPTASFALMFPAITRAGDVPYWNGSIWTTLAGNNSGTACLVENSSGAPSFTTCPTGTIVAGTTATSGISTGNFMSSTSNLVQDSGKAVPSGAVVGTTDTQTLTNKTIDTASNTFKLNGTTAGTAAQMRGATEQGMTLLSVTTLSNQATFTDTADFSATYDDYLIVISNVVPVTNATTLQMQVHSGGSYQATTYLNGSALTTAIDACNGTTISNTAGLGVSATFHVFNVNSTSVNKMVRGTGTLYTGSAASQCIGIGFWNGGQGAIDGFQILFASGNLSTGTIKVYGLRNAL